MKRRKTLSQQMAAFLGMAVIKRDEAGQVSATIVPITRLSLLLYLVWQLVRLEGVSIAERFLNWSEHFYGTFNAGLSLIAGVMLPTVGIR